MKAPRLTFLATVVILCGCASTSPSPRAAFLAGVPNERANYVQLYEVSVDSLREPEEKLLAVTKAIVRGVRESGKECQTGCPAVETRLDRIEMVADTLNKSALKKLVELEPAYNPKTDSILFFRYQSGARDESGFIVTEGGKMKKRLLFGEDWQ